VTASGDAAAKVPAGPAKQADTAGDTAGDTKAAGAGKAAGGKAAGAGDAAGGKAAGAGKAGGAPPAGGTVSLAERLDAEAAAYKVPAEKTAALSPVLIGNLGTYSGVGGILNQGTQAALRIWAAWVNARGGLNGHPVNVESFDDQGDPSTAVSFAKQLQSKGVLAFLWNYTLFTSGTLIPAIAKMGIPDIGGDDFDPAMWTTPYMFPQNAPVRTQVGAAAAYGASLGKTVGAVWWCVEAQVCMRAQQTDDANGAMEAGGVKPVMNVSVSLTQPSYLSQCSTAKAKGVQFIMAHLDGASLIRAKRDCKQIGYNPLMCNVAGAVTPQLLTTDVTKGPEAMCFSVAPFAWWAQDTPMQKAFHAAIARFAPGTPSTFGSSGVWAAGEILRSSATFLSAKPTRDELLRGLYSVKDETFGGLTLPLTYAPDASFDKPLPYFNCAYVAVISEQGQWSYAPGKKFYCVSRVTDFHKI
jgi:branched-chain amino acid transport system substrate-binding protein